MRRVVRFTLTPPLPRKKRKEKEKGKKNEPVNVVDHSHSPRLNFGFHRLRFVKFAPCSHRGVWSFCLMSWFIWRAFFFLIFFFMTESHVHTAFIHLFSTAASIFLCSSCKCLLLFGISAPKNPSPSVVDLQFVHCDCQASLTVWLCSLQPQDLLGSLLVPKHLTVALAFPGFVPKGQWLTCLGLGLWGCQNCQSLSVLELMHKFAFSLTHQSSPIRLQNSLMCIAKSGVISLGKNQGLKFDRSISGGLHQWRIWTWGCGGRRWNCTELYICSNKNQPAGM